MKWSFHPEAETEFHEAIDYYEECESGLGADFAIEVHTAIQNILTYPEAWPTQEGDIRSLSYQPIPLWCALQYRNRWNIYPRRNASPPGS